MKNFIKKILKELKLFFFFRAIYRFFFRQGYIYRKFQAFFTNINRRNQVAYFERKIINLIFFKSRSFFNSNIDQKDQYSNQLNEQGCTSAFQLDCIEKNKDLFLEYFNSQKVFKDTEPDVRFFKNDRPSDLDAGYFDNYTVARCPYIFDVVNDPLIIKTLSTFFGCPYKLDFLSGWWSFKNDSKEIQEKTQYYHRDFDNFNFIKLFLYLTDVDESSGAHQYIKFTHKKDFSEDFIRKGGGISRKVQSINELQENLSKDIQTFKGKSGSVVLENTLGLHRAKRPEINDRLMIAMSFSLVKTPFGPSKPFLNFHDLDTNLSNYNRYLNQNFIIS